MSLRKVRFQAKSGTIQATVLLSISLISLGLQILLPIYAFRFGSEKLFLGMSEPSRFRLFVTDRLRFSRFLTPVQKCDLVQACLSATVCHDELVALMSSQKEPFVLYTQNSEAVRSERTIEVFRFNLKTGKLTTTAVPPDARYVLSDGKTLWWLPNYKTPLAPFIWEGKPTSIAMCQKDQSLCHLVVFEQGEWRESDRFALLPDCFDGNGQSAIDVHVSDGRFLLVATTGIGTFHTTHVEFASKQQAREFRSRYPKPIKRMSKAMFDELGWKLDGKKAIRRSSGFWFAGSDLFGLEVSDSETQLRTLTRHTIESNEHFDVSSPVSRDIGINSHWSWNRDVGLKPKESGLKVIVSNDQPVFILSFNRPDGRIVLMELRDDTPRQVCEAALSDVQPIVLDGTMLLLLSIVVPTIALVCLASVLEWAQSRSTYQFGHETVAFAPLPRRATAGFIDFSLLAGLLVASIACHPAMLAWWHYVTHGLRDVHSGFYRFRGGGIPMHGYLADSFFDYKSHLMSCLPVPLVPWLFAIFVSVLTLQIVWQAKRGYTVGKYITGIRTVGTSLRPCGIYRSLLRELFLPIDGILFLSWIPGVTMVLGSLHRQRLGDRWADTIVICVPKTGAGLNEPG